MLNRLFILVGLLCCSAITKAELATCEIEISTHKKTTTKYNLTKTVDVDPVSIIDERTSFEIPGSNDYLCTIALSGKGNGAALSCDYTPDGFSSTYFMNDRGLLKEHPALNHLRFDHNGVHVSIKTNCVFD